MRNKRPCLYVYWYTHVSTSSVPFGFIPDQRLTVPLSFLFLVSFMFSFSFSLTASLFHFIYFYPLLSLVFATVLCFFQSTLAIIFTSFYLPFVFKFHSSFFSCLWCSFSLSFFADGFILFLPLLHCFILSAGFVHWLTFFFSCLSSREVGVASQSIGLKRKVTH